MTRETSHSQSVMHSDIVIPSDTVIHSDVVILSEAKDPSSKHYRAVSACRSRAFPISIFQFPFSTQSGGIAKS
jgi:hypothetical protein